MRSVGVEIVGAIGRRPERRKVHATGVSTDSRSIRPGEVFFALRGKRCDGHDFVADVLAKGAAAAVVSRDVSVAPHLRERVVRVGDTLRAFGDSARAYRRAWGGAVIAVTGSNGKTTTREMIHHVLSGQIACKRSPKSFNTDVGVPHTLFLADAGDEALIVEMGANAPGEIAALASIAEPDAGVITSISESHLEGLGSIEGVARAKGELLQKLGPAGMAFLNADDPWRHFLGKLNRGRTIAYGLGPDADFRGTRLETFAGGHAFSIPGGICTRLHAPGRHNVLNALAALAVVRALRLDLDAAAKRMRDYDLPDLRYKVEEIRGVTVVADCYNANPGSMRAALATFCEAAASGRRVAVLGDMLELGVESRRLHRDVGSVAGKSGLDALWAVGGHASAVAGSARESGLMGPVFCAQDLEDVEDQILEFLPPGDALLVKGSRGMRLERLVERFRAFA